jgi:ParB family chromosome partitioning protein
MAKRDDFDDFFGEEPTPVIDTRADGRLYKVPVSRIAANGVNPRTDFGTQDQLIDLGKSLARRQNQPCPVVSRTAYLKLWPDHSHLVKDVDYVLVSGERRYRAANAVGLAVLDCVVNDDFAQDRKTFMESVVSENVDRQNFDPIEEAYAVQALVAEFGSNRAVAQHFERVDGWVTQRVLLTHLAREAQALVRKKTIPLEAARSLGKLARDNEWDATAQLAWWDGEQERRAAATAARSAARKAAKQGPVPEEPVPQSFTAVKHDPVPKEDPQPVQQVAALTPQPVVVPDSPVVQNPVLNEPEVTESDGVVRGLEVPDPRTSSPAASVERNGTHPDHVLPAVGWEKLSELLVEQLSELDRHRLTRKLERIMAAEFRGTDAPEPSTS